MNHLSIDGFDNYDQLLCHRATMYPNRPIFTICDAKSACNLTVLTYKQLHLVVNIISEWLQLAGFVSQRVSRHDY